MLNQLSPLNQIEIARQRAAQVIAQKSEIGHLDDAVAWIEKYFIIPELKGPVVLAPYQKACLREALRKDEQGNYIYSTIVWSDIKKSIKSTIAAAVGLWRAFQLNWGQVIMVANDLKQADSRVGYYMRRAIELSPAMRAVAQVRNYKIDLPNHTTLESVAIDPSGEAGSNADMIIFSELWGAHQQAQARMWTEMTLPPAKFGQSFRWVETYAGFSGESGLLENLYEQGVRQGERIDDEVGVPGLEVYRNEAARLFMLWNTQPRLAWQTDAYYQQEEAILIPSEFQRVHRNQWASAEEKFVPMEWWHACRKESIPVAREPWVLAADAGVSSDCFGLVAVTRQNGKVKTRYVRKWVPPKRGKLDFARPEEELRRLLNTQNILQVAYDPYQLHDMMTRLKKEGLGWFRPFDQGVARSIADKNLYDIIRGQRLEHDGHPDLTEHIDNANAVAEGKDENKLRLVKRAPHLKIDLAVALSMAASEALRLNLE